MRKGEGEAARLIHENARLETDLVKQKAEYKEKLNKYDLLINLFRSHLFHLDTDSFQGKQFLVFVVSPD